MARQRELEVARLGVLAVGHCDLERIAAGQLPHADRPDAARLGGLLVEEQNVPPGGLLAHRGPRLTDAQVENVRLVVVADVIELPLSLSDRDRHMRSSLRGVGSSPCA